MRKTNGGTSFSLEAVKKHRYALVTKNLQLEELLLDGGKRRGESKRFRHLSGSPVRKSLVITGPKPVHKSLAIEYIYTVTQSEQKGWVKIGKTTQDPKSRLNGYNTGPITFDMNYILQPQIAMLQKKKLSVD